MGWLFRLGVDDLNHERFLRVEVHVALREGDADAHFVEAFVDHDADVAIDDQAVCFVIQLDPEVESEVEGVIAEVGKGCEGWRGFEDESVAFRGLDKNFYDVVGRGAVGDAYLDLATEEAGVECPVDDAVFEEKGVGHEVFDAVEAADDGGAGVDFRDDPGNAIDFDDVADADFALEEEDDAGDEILDDGLRAEADADGKGTGEECEDGERDVEPAQGREGEQEGDDEHQPCSEGAGLVFRDDAASDHEVLDFTADA